jgi:hypothetical protein
MAGRLAPASDSTCSGVSKISYGFLVHGRLGQQVPQHDVAMVGALASKMSLMHNLARQSCSATITQPCFRLTFSPPQPLPSPPLPVH